ncbi:hypothetical protein [Acidovorax sp.]|uniref:hypothetical protein n=1 Tax=Acidovorax sp. TaxID=1872122 RepID=UPI002ACEE2FD|nr:hypothetical protein [Acidovorax sp.]MDZ7862247.1 hypothetical protein [Acidovorax sp.]
MTWPTTPRTPCAWSRCAARAIDLATGYIVFLVLPDTLGLGPEVWRVLDKCHNTRNLGEYEGLMEVDERLVTDLIGATQVVADAIGPLPL